LRYIKVDLPDGEVK